MKGDSKMQMTPPPLQKEALTKIRRCLFAIKDMTKY